jgi:glycosyltransferase involved in cell wall biosynthesis
MYNGGNTVKGQVDIIIPAYNCKDYIAAALESVFDQTYPSDKITVTVVDDGSTDGISEFIEGLSKPKFFKFTLITKKTNKGANSARNSGLLIENGEYVFIMDGDSLLSSDALEVLVYNLQNQPSGVGYVYCGFNRLWKVGDSFVVDPWLPPDFDADILRKNNYISMMSLMRRSIIPSEGFDTTITRFQDWDMWLTLLKKGIVGKRVTEVLFNAYILPTGISKDQSTIASLQKIVLKKHGLG